MIFDCMMGEKIGDYGVLGYCKNLLGVGNMIDFDRFVLKWVC